MRKRSVVSTLFYYKQVVSGYVEIAASPFHATLSVQKGYVQIPPWQLIPMAYLAPWH